MRSMRTCLTIGLLLATPFSIHSQTTAASAASPLRPTYDNSSGGLKRQLEEAMKAARKHDRTALISLTTDMVLPDPEMWFPKVFGAEIGTWYKEPYSTSSARLPAELANRFEDYESQSFTDVQIVRFTKACDFDADELQYPVLDSRVSQEPLSVARFGQGGSYTTLQYFAYDDGSFRFVGGLAPYSTPKPIGTKTVRVPGKVQAARVVKQVPPHYPDEARRQYMEGEVILEAVVSPEGATTVRRVLKGRCIFAEPAINAVRQWRYTPTLLDGVPVPVDTTITVTFEMRRR